MEDKKINYSKRVTSADILVSHFAYIYDFNYEFSLKIIKEKEYIDKLYNRFTFNNQETKEKFDKIYETVKKYLIEKKDE